METNGLDRTVVEATTGDERIHQEVASALASKAGRYERTHCEDAPAGRIGIVMTEAAPCALAGEVAAAVQDVCCIMSTMKVPPSDESIVAGSFR